VSSADWTIEGVDAPAYFNELNQRAIAIDKVTNHPHIVYGGDHLYHAYFDGDQWQYETVDNSPNVGKYASIAIDSSNKVHISYQDVLNSDLKYATNVSGSWEIDTVDWVGNFGYFTSIAVDSNNRVHISYGYKSYGGGGHKYATNESGLWAVHTIDTAGSPANDISIAVDSNNKAHVSYFNSSDEDLKYATNKSGQWVIDTPDWEGYVGQYSSIALDSNDMVHISYFDTNNSDLKYVTNASGSWDRDIVDGEGVFAGAYTSIAIDSLNIVHISYRGAGGSLKHATNDSGSWATSITDSAAGPGSYTTITIDSNNKVHISSLKSYSIQYTSNVSGPWVTSTTIDTSGSVGKYTSIALDSNNRAHISYLDNTNNDIKYATNTTGSWVISTIDLSKSHDYISLALDSNDKAHISYYEDGDLKYVTNASGPWLVSTVDSSGDVGRYSSIAVDSNNKAHVSYFDYTNQDLKYATNASGQWVTSVIDWLGNVGVFASMAIDSDNKVHISYHEGAYKNLKYATNASGSWVKSIIDSAGDVGRYCSIAVDSNNKAHISYFSDTFGNLNDNVLKYATNARGLWEASAIDGAAVRSTSIALDSNNKVHISYYKYSDPTNSVLKYISDVSGDMKRTTIDMTGLVGEYTSIAVDTNNMVHISYFDISNLDLKYATNKQGIAGPDINISPVSLNYGRVFTGATSDMTLTVRSDGSEPLIIGSIAQADPVTEPFSIVTDNCSGRTLAPTVSCDLIIRFAPVSEGNFSDILDIPSNDPDETSRTVLLNGNGFIPGPDIVTSDEINFGSLYPETTSDMTLTLYSDGSEPLIIGSIAQADPVTEPFSIVTDDCSGRTLASTISCDLIIRFAPESGGYFNDSFNIPSNDPDENPITVSLSGVGFIPDEDFETGDLSRLPWITGGGGAWTVQSGQKFDGSYSAEASKSIEDGQLSYLEVILNITNPGDISFMYKVSSQMDYDVLQFKIDGEVTGMWSGNEGWTNARFAVSPGIHTFRWEYKKNEYTSYGEDTAWLDDIGFPPYELTYRISGNVTNAAMGLSGITMNMSGARTATVKTDSTGYYIFKGLLEGNYTLIPFREGYTFTPASRDIVIADSDITSSDFQVVPPDLDVFPPQLSFHLPEGGSADDTLIISNNGTGSMAYYIYPTVDAGQAGQSSVSSLESSNELISSDISGNRIYSIPESAEFSKEHILVKFKEGMTSSEKKSIHSKIGAEVLKSNKKIKVDKVKVTGGKIKEAINKYLKDKRVEYAEPDYIVKALLMPNDPGFSELWGLHNTGQSGGTADADVDAPETWDIATGEDVIVAVIDTGVDYNHEDLSANMWLNTGEIPDNGLDDDGNGYIDDYRGWDFSNNDNDPMDDHYHGTHCAGTIAGLGNNGVGVVGVNWTAKIMPLKFLDAYGSGYSSDAMEAILYAQDKGVRISSNSWGGGPYSQALYDAIESFGESGGLFVAAAANGGIDQVGDNNDIYPIYPASYNNQNIISVAATDRNDALASFSNYGVNTVDLAAPGVSIYSTILNNGYAYKSGTSMATPHVAGVAALVLSKSPYLSVDLLKNAILSSVDPIPSLHGKLVTGGRLNAWKAMFITGQAMFSLSSLSGVVAPGASEIINVTANAGSLPPDTYDATLFIYSNDPDENPVTVPVSIVVGNLPPVAVPNGPFIDTEGQAIALDGSGSNDPDGNIALYEWDIDNDGTYNYSSSSSTQRHAYSQQGTYTIRLRVTDDLGASASATTTATISDTLPTADFTGSPTSGPAPLTVNFSNSSTGYDQPLTYAWDFDNSGTTHSTDLNPSALYTGQGIYSVKLTVTDSDGSTNTLIRSNYITVTPPGYTLTINKAGSGSGPVTSSPAGIDCGSDCAETYSTVTNVTLTALPDAGSKFAGWSGGCSGTGICALTMNASKTITATFDACANLPVRIIRGGTPFSYYSSIQTAYNNSIAGDVIQVQAALFTESFNAADISSKSITIEGGYDCGYTAVIGKTAIKGQTTISKGTNRIRNVVVKK